MAVFIETQTDPFVKNRDELVTKQKALRQAGDAGGVRRPVRGIEIKQDTYAVIRVMKSDGSFINVIDQAGGFIEGEGSVAKTSNYTNFFIQAVAEERHEKQQIVDTFGDAFIFFFGEAPRITQVSGVLLNTNDFNWRNEFWANYEKYFRGTRLVEQNARLYLIYDDIIIEGYMLAASAQDDANRPHLISFNFQIFVTGYSTISALGDPNFPSPDDSMDYTKQTSYGQALKRANANRPIQKETNTDIARRNLRRSGGPILGSIGGLAMSIRSNSLLPDPSTASFTASLTGTFNSLSSLVRSISGSKSRKVVTPALRKLPLRSTFRDNTDEFIGGNDYLNARQLASPLSMAEYWQKMDAAVDMSLFDVVSNTASLPLFDLMGRGGRSMMDMRNRGGKPAFFRSNQGKMAEGSVRKVPFGMAAVKEK